MKKLLLPLLVMTAASCGGEMPEEATTEDSLSFGTVGTYCGTFWPDTVANTLSCAEQWPNSDSTVSDRVSYSDVDWWKLYSNGANVRVRCSGYLVTCEFKNGSNSRIITNQPLTNGQSASLSGYQGWVYIRVHTNTGGINPVYYLDRWTPNERPPSRPSVPTGGSSSQVGG